jgi:hypothetical protein
VISLGRPCFYQRAVGSLFSFLGVFALSRKAAISFVISVRPSVRMYEHCSYWTFFSLKFDIVNFYESLLRNSRLVNMEQKYHVLYMKTEVDFIVAGVINLP